MVFVALGLGTTWIAQWLVALLRTTTPGRFDLEPEFVRTTAALDLTLMVGLLVPGAVLLLRRSPWGVVLAAVTNVSGALYCLVLAAGTTAQIRAGLDEVRTAGTQGAPAAPANAEVLSKGLSLDLTMAAIETLGDTESEQGSAAIVPYTTHRNVKVRRAAVKSLTRTKGNVAAAAFKKQGTKVGTDLKKAADQLSTTFSGIQKLDSKGELEAAVKAAPECAFLSS